jgi:hypothetical protein
MAWASAGAEEDDAPARGCGADAGRPMLIRALSACPRVLRWNRHGLECPG